MNAAIYARKSTEQNGVADEAKSVTRQIEHATAYAAKKGWTVAAEHVYMDDGISGAEFARRSGLPRLMNALKPRPPFQVLIMSEESSRLGREQIETAYLLKQIITAGVRVFSYLDDRELTLDSPTDKVLLSLTTFADELEREKARQRTRDALVRKARQGHVTGGRVFGYDNVEVVDESGKRRYVIRKINGQEAIVVRRIFEMYAAGVGLRSIAITLNDEEALAPLPRRSGRSRSLAPSSVRAILHNELYRGVVVWGRTQKRDRWGQKKSTPRPEDDWERREVPELRIVSDELWEAAHTRLRAARRFYERTAGVRPAGVRVGGKYLLSELAACGCGGAMIVRSRTSGAGRCFVYACGYHHTRGRSVCDNALLAPMEATDRAVLEAIDHDVLNPRVLARAAEQAIAALCPPADAVEEQRATILGQMRRLEAELANLAKAIAEPGGNIPALLHAAKDREAQRARCEQQLAALESARRLSRVERARIDRQVREVLTDRQGLLSHHTPQAREILRNLFEGRLIFTPAPEERIYAFSGQAALGRLLAGTIPAYGGLFNSERGPNGIRPTDVFAPAQCLIRVPFDGLALTGFLEPGPVNGASAWLSRSGGPLPPGDVGPRGPVTRHRTC